MKVHKGLVNVIKNYMKSDDEIIQEFDKTDYTPLGRVSSLGYVTSMRSLETSQAKKDMRQLFNATLGMSII